jgi:hypothetical protein
MRLRRWLAIALLSMCSLGFVGCLGVAGDFVLGDGVDASTDQSTSVDGSPKSDGTISPEADADADSSPLTDSHTVGAEPEPESEADAPEAVEAAPPDAACTLSGPCTPGSTPLGPCMSAEYVCPDGGSSVCVAAPVTNGTPCNDAGTGGDAGAAVTEVCYNGVCGACSAGTACPATNPCQENLNDCSSGQAVCEDAGFQPDGTRCNLDGGSPLYCNDGKCSACLLGSSCTANGAPCNEATVTACSAAGAATCTPTTKLVANGTSCGSNEVCYNGQCDKCTAMISCTPTDVQCHVGQISCTTGQPLCVDKGAWAPDFTTACSDGLPCTLGDACRAGKCVGGPENPCTATDQCHTTGVCNPTTGVCSNPSKANGISCNEDDNACTSDTCQAGVCKMGGEVSCESPAKCQTAPGSCTNKVTGQCMYPAVVCAGVGCQEAVGTCSPTTGQCSYTAGTCREPTGCETGNGTCNDVDGGCSYPICTTPGVCQTGTGSCSSATGKCVYPAVVCAGVGCQEAVGTCSPTTGQCSYTAGTCREPTGCETGNGTCNDVDGGCSYPICTTPPNECEGAGSCVGGVCQYAFLAAGFVPNATCVCDGMGHCVPVPEAGAPDGGDTD